ncbi:MAG: 3-phosphoshikimate 1-carboxyvinyltransferase [Bacteroidia bacterium]
MNYFVSHPTKKVLGTITLTASKSESNRALLIQALSHEKFTINNLASANDTVVMQNILRDAAVSITERVYNVEDAGTAARFLTAFFATKKGTHILLCSDRMKERPIGVLVDALRSLGADIQYMEKEGFLPLKITGKKLLGTSVETDGNVSSQFISALLLISPELPNGLVIRFKGEVTSRPYINMTLKMMEEFRVYGQWHDQYISVSQQQYHKKSEPSYLYEIEGDWSSASYLYACVALAEQADITIKGLKNPSLQGDAIVADLFVFFGVKTEYVEGGIRLTKIKSRIEEFVYDFSDCPDLVQTVAVVVSALGIKSLFNGVHTLKIKETDRITALQNELKKINTTLNIKGDNAFEIFPSVENKNNTSSTIEFLTYNDHRMAMAFAPLAIVYNNVKIESSEVVKKSYPDFWNDFKCIGFTVKEA